LVGVDGLRREDGKAVVTLAGCVLVIVVLYWAQAILVPFAVAILLTFVLTPPVTWLQRWIGRVPAVLAVVTLVFAVLGLTGWGLARQMTNLADDLPVYRANILTKIADVRGAGKGGSVEKLQETIEEIKNDLGKSEVRKGTVVRPVVESIARLTPEPVDAADDHLLPGPREPLRVLGYAANGVADELARAMLAHVVDDLPIAIEITGARMQASVAGSAHHHRALCAIGAR
jgi:hypothetical protein